MKGFEVIGPSSSKTKKNGSSSENLKKNLFQF